MTKPIHIRLNEQDQAAYNRLVDILHTKQPWQEPTASDVLRLALYYSTTMVCPHCETELVEKTDDEGGSLGVWICPECSMG